MSHGAYQGEQRVLAAAPDREQAEALREQAGQVHRRVDSWWPEARLPRTMDPYRLLLCQLGESFRSPEALLRVARPDAHVVVVLPRLDVRWVAYFMQDPRVNHFLLAPLDLGDLSVISRKLASGSIFGLHWYLPRDRFVSVQRRELHTFDDRCRAMDDVAAFAEEQQLRRRVRQATGQVLEEMLMNAMYQAPVDPRGRRLFAEIDPKERLRHKTPRPVWLRFAAVERCLYLAVRDHYGSFRRADFAARLLRCAATGDQIEQKKLGAGLGLYLMASNAASMVVNVYPRRVSEFICCLGPPSRGAPLRLLSTTFLRPAPDHVTVG